MFLEVFPGEAKEEKCILAIESFAKDYLNMFLQEPFDKTLKQFTEETLKLASSYNFELDKLRAATENEKAIFMNLISEITKIVDPHGLIASWFLTWFVHEFPNFDDSMAIFDFQLTEISTHFAPIYLASSVVTLECRSI